MQLRQPLNLRKPLQMTAHKIRPTLNLPFAASGSLGPLITYTGQNGTYFNSSGTLTAATTNVARFDYDPSTLIARGLLIEEARTNSIRNNTMVGAVVGVIGSGGAIPTNWSWVVNTTTGLTQTVVATGTESGISYVDLRLSGTASGAGSTQIAVESNTQIVATQNQVWTISLYSKLVAGSFTGLTTSNTALILNSYTAAGVFDANGSSLVRTESTPTGAALNTQRQILTGTLASATTARVNGGLFLTIANGAAIDITLRIGMPQLELGAFATSVISTSSAAVTRAADLASITGANFTSFWNATQGTIVVGFMNEANVPAATFPTVVRAGDGTTNNFITINQINTGNRTYAAGRVGGVDQWDINSGSATYNTTALTAYKSAIAYQANNIGYSLAGTAAGTDTSATIPTVDRLEIGSANSSGFVNGWISSLSYYPVRLTNTQLQTLST